MELVTISLRVPKSLNDELERQVVKDGYATKTELIRDWIRKQLAYKRLDAMRGALKGKVPPLKESMREWRKKEWQGFLDKAGGDRKKAADLYFEDLDAFWKDFSKGLIQE